MRLLRLQLKHFRGIEEVDIHFNHTGLTVIEGPNEIGKTSLFESINVLFNYPDSSNSSRIKAIKPVNKDIGAEIVLEAESGPYTFNYFKRFHKKSETTLSIHKPNPENLTGREAHDRAKTILEETVDTNLWSALNINQGEELKQANFKNVYPLTEALDKSAGGKTTNPQEENLFELIKKEFNTYFTENKREKRILQEARDRKEEMEDTVNSISTRLKDLESYLEKIPYLKVELQKNYNQQQKIEENISHANKILEQTTKLENELETSRVFLESSNNSLKEAKKLKDTRTELSKKITKLNKEIKDIQHELTELNKSYKVIKNKYKDEKNNLKNSQDSLDEAEKLLNIRIADNQYLNDKLFLEQMTERKNGIDEARDKAASAEIVLANNIVDKEGLDNILNAEKKYNENKAKSNISLPKLLILGLSESSINLNKQKIEIRKDSELTYKIDKNIEINIPEKLNISISPGQSTEEILNKVEAAENELSTICKKYSVNNADEAKDSFDKRQNAIIQINEKDKIETSNLRDLTYEELDSKVRNLNISVSSYFETRESDTSVPKNTTESRQLLQKSQKNYDEVRKKKSSIEKIYNAISDNYHEMRGNLQELEVKIQLKSSEFENEEIALSKQREEITDEELESKTTSLDQEVNNINDKIKGIEDSLKDLGADNINLKLDTYKESQEQIEKRINDIHTELTTASTRIQIMGEEGLQEKLDAAKTSFEQSALELKNITRKADAANLLYTIMNEEREKAKQSYIKPFKTNIEKLGKLLFNNSFEVQMSEDLEVLNRTLDGVTIPYDDLSGGTKEQLSLISRLACGTIVGKESGAPIIIDDALGYTDPVRLESMGVILATAGKTSQIIILTCMPDRYSLVGDAKFINMTNEYQALQ